MFTLEINGEALVVTNADETSARALLESDEFKQDLQSFTSDGDPLWDGTSALTIRPSSEDEIEAFDEALDDEEYEEEGPQADNDDDDDEDPIDIVFLVEIDEENDIASA